MCRAGHSGCLEGLALSPRAGIGPQLLSLQVPPGGNKTQYEEISIPVALLSHRDLQDIFMVGSRQAVGGGGFWGTVGPPPSKSTLLWEQRFGRAVMVALYAPGEPVMDYNMVIIFLMAVGTVALGGYWAGLRDVKK